MNLLLSWMSHSWELTLGCLQAVFWPRILEGSILSSWKHQHCTIWVKMTKYMSWVSWNLLKKNNHTLGHQKKQAQEVATICNFQWSNGDWIFCSSISEEYEYLPAVITLSCSFSLLFRPTPSKELLKLLSSSFLGTVLQSSSSSLHACSCYYRVLWCFPSPILWRIILDCRINSHQDWQAANSLLLPRTFTGNWGILFVYELASHVEEQEIQEHICLQIDGLMHQHKHYETLYKILNILWLHITVEDVL